MKIQLLFADQELELTKDVQLPLNKAFQNLWNPTDIIVDYSKTISIPMTVNNNRVLGNAYRLDRVVIDRYRMRAGDENIGVYLDPTKKIPFQLLYNGQSLMEGYAKFTSANYSENKKFYNFNLFGSLGGYFLKMQDVKTSYEKLTDDQKAEGGDLYVLNDHLQNSSLSVDYVYNSWIKENNNINDFSDPTINNHDIVGFAPTYRGYYGLNFASDKFQVNEDEIKLISEVLEEDWKASYCIDKYKKPISEASDGEIEVINAFVEKLNASELISDGLKDYQLDEYRSYHLKPYIYFNKLLYMFQEKSRELTGYELKLDETWFNKYNPYWTKLIYTLNFLDNPEEIPTNKIELEVVGGSNIIHSRPSDGIYCKTTHTTTIPIQTDYMKFGGKITTKITYDNRWEKYNPNIIQCVQKSYIVYEINVKTATSNRSTYAWSYLWSDTYTPPERYLTESNKIFTSCKYNANGKALDELSLTFECNFNDLDLNVPINDHEAEITVVVTLRNHYSGPIVMVQKSGGVTSNIWNMWKYPDRIIPDSTLVNFAYNSSHNNSINVGLDVLYLEDEPLFNVILQYTKMYGLLWKLDDVDKTVTICRRSTYFNNMNSTPAENWDHKVDRTKDYVIEPITFDTKYVKFNYEDVDGYKFKPYKDKYGVPYGTLKLNTSYDFDSGDSDLFDGVNPSLVSQRSFHSYADYRAWDFKSYIPPRKDVIDRIESASSDDGQGLNASSWYFRGKNVDCLDGVYLTDDSELMNNLSESCYYKRTWLEDCISKGDEYVRKMYEMPTFNVVSTSGSMKYGCLFNCPKEDYTSRKEISKANGYYIYDNFWNKYIDERYNVQNKKVTAYFNITPYDYLNFDFNKLIILDGQLFMINKIFDYDLNTSASTKCELVQVSDPSAYTDDIIVFEDPGEKAQYTLTINPTPENAKVYMNGELTKSLKVEHGSEVYVEVSADNYHYWSDTIVVTSDYAMDVNLQKDTSIIRRFAIDATPYDAIVKINGLVAKSLSVHNWDEVVWEVSREGYHTQTGTIVVTQDITIPVNLSEDYKDVITFTIIPDPADAVVSINSTPTTSIETEPGAYISWLVRKDGYTTQSDTFKIYESQTLNVVLEKKGIDTAVFTLNPTPSDAHVYLYVRSDVDSPSPYAGTEVEGVGKQSITVAVGDWVSWSAKKDGYVDRAGLYQMTTSENFTYDVVMEELGAITYDLLSHPDPIQTISADAQTLTFKVSSRKMIPRPDGSGSDVEFLDVNASNAVNCTVTKQNSISGDAKEFVVKFSENTSNAKRIGSFTVTQDETGDTINYQITQAYNSYVFEEYSLSEYMSYEGGQGTCWIRSLKNGNNYPIDLIDVSITGIYGATVDYVRDDSLEYDDGVYGIVYTIPENTSNATRTAVLTVTHPVTNETLTFNIEQDYYKPVSTRKVNVIAEPIYDSVLNSVSYEVYFDASKLNGGNLTNVVIQVSDFADGSGSNLGSRSLGTINVPAGTKSDTYTGLFNNIRVPNPWFLVYYDNTLQYYANCIQEQLDPLTDTEGDS